MNNRSVGLFPKDKIANYSSNKQQNDKDKTCVAAALK